MVAIGLGYGYELGMTSLTVNLIGFLSMLTFKMKLDGHHFLIQFQMRLVLLFTSPTAINAPHACRR